MTEVAESFISIPWFRRLSIPISGLICFLVATAYGADNPSRSPRIFKAGHPIGIQDLPPGRFQDRIDRLPPAARQRALDWLGGFTFTDLDLVSLCADDQGGIYYADEDLSAQAPTDEPTLQAAATANGPLPVSPFPDALKFHSRPGSPNRVYIDFDGHVVSGTAWNNSLGRDPVQAVAFSSDGDFTTYSDSEQLVIKRVWQRMAEDLAPFDIDVTTEEPTSIGNRTAHALITRNTDASGQGNPSSSAGGVAYVNVFGSSSFASTYSPAWIYYNNLGSVEHNIAEAASHEIGHNLGLSHDGKTDGASYYSGHGSGATSWAPIMGVGYSRQVTQWSKGEYYLANNTQDDLSIIAGKLNYRDDDHGDTHVASSLLTLTDGANIFSTTPENDPENTDPSNKGVIERDTDTDVFAFTTGAGQINISVSPWISPVGNRGGNLDVAVELRDSTGELIADSNPADQTMTTITAAVPEGAYYLHIHGTGTGSPLSSPPSGYTAYAALGQYFISGAIADNDGVSFPPTADASVSDITTSGQGVKSFTVTYSDDEAVDVNTIDGTDLRVTGPNGYDQAAVLVGVDDPSDGTPRIATYSVDPPGTEWAPPDNGVYTIWLESNQVADIQGAYTVAGELGTFTTSIPHPNVPPSVSIINPAEDSVFTEGDSILLTASASDPDGTVVKVEFYVNSTQLGEDTQSPYEFTWTNAPAGVQTVYVKALDNEGATTSSASRSLTVLPRPNEPPIADASVSDITTSGQGAKSFTVTYTDDEAVDVSTIDNMDVRVTGPHGYDQAAVLVGVDDPSDGTPRIATYVIDPPGTEWAPADNGVYTIWMESNQVADFEGAYVGAEALGTFTCTVPHVLYAATMTSDPAWTPDPGWDYGIPAGNDGDPSSGVTGAEVIGYNLNGGYDRRLDPVYAMTPPINCSGADTVSLQFKRWLGVSAGDTALIEISVNGVNWTPVWSASGAVNDGVWVDVQYELTSVAAGQSAVCIRWGMGSNQDRKLSFGWNLDDLLVVGTGAGVDNYTLTPTPGPNGSISPSDPVMIVGGGSTSFVMTAAAHYHIADVLTNGVSVGPFSQTDTSYTQLFSNVTSDQTIDASFTINRFSLTIDSPYGSSTPTGANTYDDGTLIHASVAGSPAVFGTTQHVAGGWTGTGSASQSGTGTNVSFTIATDSTLSWQWQTQYWLDTETIGNGSVDVTDGWFDDGSNVIVSASPDTGYRFDRWAGDIGVPDPSNAVLSVIMDTARMIQAIFEEIMTTNYPTSILWLQTHGYTNDYEEAVTEIGSNGIPLWQSYVAGLDPNDSNDVFQVAIDPPAAGVGNSVLMWPSVVGRLYTLQCATNLNQGFEILPGAEDLPFSANSFTDTVHDAESKVFYGISVRME